jgi:hypothetical protein
MQNQIAPTHTHTHSNARFLLNHCAPTKTFFCTKNQLQEWGDSRKTKIGNHVKIVCKKRSEMATNFSFRPNRKKFFEQKCCFILLKTNGRESVTELVHKDLRQEQLISKQRIDHCDTLSLWHMVTFLEKSEWPLLYEWEKEVKFWMLWSKKENMIPLIAKSKKSFILGKKIHVKQ